MLGVYLFISLYPSSSYPVIYKVIVPVITCFVSATVFFIGHFSYPRVQNLKVYLSGYLTGLTGVAYILFTRFGKDPHTQVSLLELLILFNWLLIVLLPSYAKYRTTKRFSRSILVLELLLLGWFYTLPLIWTSFQEHGKTGFPFAPVWVPGAVMGLILLLSLVVMRNEFFLGGLASGCSLFFAVVWFLPLFMHQSRSFEQMVFAVVPVYLASGVLFHWISRMDHRLSYDPLLQVYNRDYCFRIINEQSNTDTSVPFGVAMIDIDHFKQVNDTYGHQAGDRVLFDVAQTTRRSVVPRGIVCRYGGEEMAVFFPGKKTSQVVPVMEKVRREVESMNITWDGRNIDVTISCGVSCRDRASQSISEVVKAADRALYRAKNSGRNQVKHSRAEAGR